MLLNFTPSPQSRSNLLAHIQETLEQAELHKHVPGAIGSPDDKVAFLVGHDTNIANVAALLDAHWLISGYQRDDAAPGGALVFELWHQDGQEDSRRPIMSSRLQIRCGTPSRVSLSRASPQKRLSFFPAVMAWARVPRALSGHFLVWSDG